MVHSKLMISSLILASWLFMSVSYAEIWYREDFDNLANGNIVGQDTWAAVVHWKAKGANVQGDIAFGNIGKSLLVGGGEMVVRKFPGAHADIQHVSLHSRKEIKASQMIWYLGGGPVRWGAGTVFTIKGGKLKSTDGKDWDVDIFEIKHGEWNYYHIVMNFKTKEFDFYVDGKKVADDFKFREPDNPSLDWFFFGSHPDHAVLEVYIDNISIGTGAGNPNFHPDKMPVSSSRKLAAVWAKLKS